MSSAFSYPISVDPQDIDHMGHVNNAVYLRWIQETVVAFWQAHAPSESMPRYLWIALEHTIRYLKPAFLGDPLHATMIAQKATGSRAYFSAQILNGAQVLAEVTSCWCALDSTSRRPKRIELDVVEAFFS